MQAEDLVDMEALARRLDAEGRNAFMFWLETAHEVAPENYHQIGVVRSCYADISHSELRERHFSSFVKALLETMPTLEQKKTLLRAMAFGERKFER